MLTIFLGKEPQAYRPLSKCWDEGRAGSQLAGFVGESTHADPAVRGELIELSEKVIDLLLTRVIPYLSVQLAEEHMQMKMEESRSLPPFGLTN